MKHPRFRVKSVLDLDSSTIDLLEKLGRDIISCLPLDLEPVDFELVGSLANGYSTLHSDIDLALPMKDWNDQIKLRRLLNDRMDIGNAVRVLINAFGTKWGIIMPDFNPVIPDNKESKTYATYSVFERKLYGKPADLSLQYLIISPYTQKYVLKKYDSDGVIVNSKIEVRAFEKKMVWAYDEWDKDGTTDKWRKIYGDKFQEYKVLPDGQLSE